MHMTDSMITKAVSCLAVLKNSHEVAQPAASKVTQPTLPVFLD